jgi:hypothetical protein
MGKGKAPEVVRAQRFEVADAEGEVRAALGVKPDSSPGPGLGFLDETGLPIWRAP